MSSSVTLLPHVRTALAARAGRPTSGGRRRVELDLEIRANGATPPGEAPIRTSLDLLGAGDVLAVEGSAIARVEPAAGARGVEPNYFPYVEFVDIDFPWRYSLVTGEQERVSPWLALVALEADEIDELPSRDGALPRLIVLDPAKSLPDPLQLWAMAHAQLASALRTETSVRAQLRDYPEDGFSRLLCTRRLKDLTAYRLFLVPTFEAGRQRGLGISPSPTPWNAFAWGPGTSSPLELPYYRAWRFTTSAMVDFEELVRRLRPNDDIGSPTRRVHAGSPGYYPYHQPGESIDVEGALVPPGFVSPAPVRSVGYTPQLRKTLQSVVETSERDGPDVEDPLVALPAYGRHYAEDPDFRGSGGDTPWLVEANLDLRFRLAAGAGARAIRRHQEHLAKLCWNQVGEVRAANAARARLQTAERLGTLLVRKHFEPLPAPVSLQMAEPLIDFVRTPSWDAAVIRTGLKRRGFPRGYGTRSARRFTARRPTPSLSDGPWRPPIVLGPGGPASQRKAWAQAPSKPRFELGKIPYVQLQHSASKTLQALPLERARTLLTGLTEDEQDHLETLVRGPRIAMPVSRYVEEEDPRLVLPSLENLPDETVSLAQENRRFLEAFLVGCNHEMNRELLWREYPSDPQTTVLPRFWERGEAPQDTHADDIEEVAGWKGHLGEHAKRSDPPNLVLVIKGELVRRYDDFTVTLNRQTLRRGIWSAGAGQDLHPSFVGKLGADTRYYGFEIDHGTLAAAIDKYFFVIAEAPGHFRFGLDIATYEVRRDRRDLSKGPKPFDLASLVTAARGAASSSGKLQWTRLPSAPPPVAGTWNDLSWDHVDVGQSGYVKFTHPVQVTQGDNGEWGDEATSASLARVLLQKPVRVVVAAGRLVPGV